MSEARPALAEAAGLRTHPLTGVVQGALWAVGASAGLVSSVFTGDGWGNLGPWLSLLIALVAGLVVGMVYGFLAWLFTRYVIDGTELRITSGLLTRSSRRIPYERIQSVDIAEPLVARLFGLAELRVEMAGGKDSRTTLRFLTLADTRALRTVLLARAHGTSPAGAGQPVDEEDRSVITIVPPSRVVIGTVLSIDFLVAVVGLVVLLVVSVWFDQLVVLLGGIVPFGTWLFQIVLKRVLQQWSFTLSRGDRGLRIERGLLSRTSQTIPYSRVQGVAVKEPLIWRALGWQRLEVDIAGYASHDDDQGTSSTSTLLPICDPSLAAAVTAELVPGAPEDTDERTRAPRRSWVFAPIGWRYRWIAASDRTFAASTGWLERSTSIVPHHKMQSVELRQGPLQRLLRLATVEVHTPKGPVDADGRHLDARDARAALVRQLRR